MVSGGMIGWLVLFPLILVEWDLFSLLSGGVLLSFLGVEVSRLALCGKGWALYD